MKTSETKTSTNTAAQVQKTASPFFSKEGAVEPMFFGGAKDTDAKFFSRTTIQPKLKIGKPDDMYERQADAVADQVVQNMDNGQSVMGNSGIPSVQSKCESCEKEDKLQKKEEDIDKPIENIHRKPIFDSAAETPPDDNLQRKCTACEAEESIQRAGDTEGGVSEGFSSQLTATKGGGQAMPSDVKDSMGSAIGADFSNVRVHTDRTASDMSQSIQAQAFTHGNDVYFNEGKYNPASSEGRHLLAHELTHTVQQGATTIRRVPDVADYRITGLYAGRATKPNIVFFDFDSAVIDAAENAKIVALAVPPAQGLTLVGKASEEGGRVANWSLVRRRINAVRQVLNNNGHTGRVRTRNESGAGRGDIRYAYNRQVEIIPAGVVSNEVNCATHPNPDIDCAATYPSYANFGGWLGNAQARVQAGIDALAANEARIRPLMLRFFGDNTDATKDILVINYTALLNHLQNNVQLQHNCHNRCDPSCVSSIAYNINVDGAASKTLCPNFFTLPTDDARIETLIHESVHGTGAMGGPPDFTYRWARLFGTPNQAVAIDTANAVKNPDSLTFFLREIHAAGSTLPEAVADDNYVGMDAAQRRAAFVALGWAQWWLVRDGQLMSQVFGIAVNKQRRGFIRWGGTALDWDSRIVHAFHIHFGTRDYPRVPNLTDRNVYAGITDRFMTMRLRLNPAQTFNIAAPGIAVATWDAPTNTCTLPVAFFGLPLLTQIHMLLLALAQSTPGISLASAAHYPPFADDVRQTDNLGP
jgi:hypothetical protein